MVCMCPHHVHTTPTVNTWLPSRTRPTTGRSMHFHRTTRPNPKTATVTASVASRAGRACERDGRNCRTNPVRLVYRLNPQLYRRSSKRLYAISSCVYMSAEVLRGACVTMPRKPGGANQWALTTDVGTGNAPVSKFQRVASPALHTHSRVHTE